MVNALRLQHFRSYTDARFEFSPSATIIVGPNASGKTNLLEAVLVVARGSSYRAKDTELVQHGQEWARIDADTDHGKRTVKIIGEPPQKMIEIDGRSFQRLNQNRTLPVVLFEPNHMLLLSGPPDLRRTFLDDLIEQTTTGFSEHRRHYKRVLSQRNTLLKKNPKNLHEQLFVWNIRLSELGGKIVRERVRLIEQSNQQVSELYGSISGKPTNIVLTYATQFPEESYETALLQKLEQSTELDVLRGFTAYGPHRDDLQIEINSKPFQQNASRGETRTLVLTLKVLELQQIEQARDTKPLLLLDDVFSELDKNRRAALTVFVKDYQTIITTTDADAVAGSFATAATILKTI